MDRIKIILINDDATNANDITIALDKNGYDICSLNFTMGIEIIINELKPGAIILNLKKVTTNGVNMISQIHSVMHEVPIIVVSSHTEGIEKEELMAAGATIYLTDPFTIEALTPYIKIHKQKDNKLIPIKIGTLELNRMTYVLSQHSEIIKKLSKLEFQLLVMLYAHRNEVVEYKEIKKLWCGILMNNHTLYNYIHNLRKYLIADPQVTITTVRNGYMLEIKE